MIGEIIASFAQAFTVERRSIGVLDDTGRYTRPAPSVVNVNGAIVPENTPAQLMRLPEGDRTQEAIRVFTQTLLRTAREPSMYEADVIVYNGRRWEVSAVEQWDNGGFWDCLAVKRTQSAENEATAYYGTSTTGAIEDLVEVNVNGRQLVFDANAGAGEFVYYVYPAAFGPATFYVGDFQGGFVLVTSTLDIGGVLHRVYKSAQPTLGQLQVRAA
jgi:hypothetical protein